MFQSSWAGSCGGGFFQPGPGEEGQGRPCWPGKGTSEPTVCVSESRHGLLTAGEASNRKTRRVC